MNAIDLIVEDDAWNALGLQTSHTDAVVRAVCEELDEVTPGVVALLLTDDAAVAQLNQTYRGKSGPTNVLSFPALDHADNHLGDIAMAWGVIAKEASDRQIDVTHHLKHLIIHGFLHLQGYDHQTDEEAEVMEGIECRALARLGIANPYASERETGKAGTA